MTDHNFKFIPNPINVEFCFSPKQQYQNTRVSDFLKGRGADIEISEKTSRPVYYHYKYATYLGKEYVALYYVLFYDRNPGYTLLPCIPSAPKVGEHVADVERVVILFDKYTQTPQHVYFGAHGSGQGVWVPYKKCEFSPSGALRIYVSPTSHGMYPNRALYPRVFLFANDITLHNTVVWHPKLEHFEDAHKQSWTESHYQVVRGINNPRNVPDPAETSVTPWERFALALPNIQKKLKSTPKLQTTPITIMQPLA